MTEIVNATALREARKARKLSFVEVADFTKISEASLRRFETGEAQPSFNQLAKLGELYNVEAYGFFSRAELRFEATLPDFRKSAPSAANLSPRGLTRIWQIENSGQFVEDLVEALGKDAPKLASLQRLTNKAIPTAAELRAGFDAWLAERASKIRFTGSKEDNFTRHLRLFLETRGCLTSLNAAPVDDYLGFYAKISAQTKMVFVNRELKHDKRRLFTLSHEMAHFLFDEQGVSNPFIVKNDIERRCNAFAAEFLAPDDSVFQLLSRPDAPPSSDTNRLVTYVARFSLLSRQATALRLRDLDVISRRAASSFFVHLNSLRRDVEPEEHPKPKPAMGAAAAVGKKLSEVGVYAAYVASVALQKNIVDVVDVERGLGISEKLQTRVLSLAEKRFEASAE